MAENDSVEKDFSCLEKTNQALRKRRYSVMTLYIESKWLFTIIVLGN